jgi:hypothetical protein
MSFFTAIIVVKYLLKAIASIKIFGKTWLYGTKGVAR